MSLCPCGCNAELAGRQKAATPACRKRLERLRKHSLVHQVAEPLLFCDPEKPVFPKSEPAKCDIKPSHFEASPFVWPVEKRDFSSPDYDVMRDMTLQPAFCVECGGIMRREAAYLFCQSNKDHWSFIECVGREEHPRHSEWIAYLELNGLEAFDLACDRHIAAKR